MSAQSVQNLTLEELALRYLKSPFSLPWSQVHLLQRSSQRDRCALPTAE